MESSNKQQFVDNGFVDDDQFLSDDESFYSNKDQSAMLTDKLPHRKFLKISLTTIVF